MLTPFLETDIAPFLAMATEEGWICDWWEFDFLLRHFPRGCFVCREGKSALGYIISVRYGTSGWIGNLLVHPQARKRGIGRELMKAAVTALVTSGVETVWLTASEKGAGLYQRLGFVPVDYIRRWTGERTGLGMPDPVEPDLESIVAIDRGGWGDRRESLLLVTCGRGRLYSSAGGFLCCQPWDDGVQIGPWGCLAPQRARGLLQQALAGPVGRVFLDVPAANQQATLLLEGAGFSVRGETMLMYLGAPPLYRPDEIYALASMGSMG